MIRGTRITAKMPRTSAPTRRREEEEADGDYAAETNFVEAVKNRMRDAFVARRMENKSAKPKKGKELRMIPAEWKEDFAKSDRDEWKKWISYDAVEWPSDAELKGIDLSGVLSFRMLRTDKNDATRGSKSFAEHPLKAKSRGVLPGYQDKQFLSGE